MLSLLLIIPLIGCLLLSFIEVKNNELEETTNSKMKKIALNTSLINLFISIIC
jgi:NADH:ubiquinone oxidoreductase subunit 4 (subunit M)